MEKNNKAFYKLHELKVCIQSNLIVLLIESNLCHEDFRNENLFRFEM